ncbi:MAG: ATP-binding cassette domain-containing protein [Bacteroidales bacterium]|nr:ATP-binding cassette domain-containing protein [Bacteroidales bacterium]
MILELENINKTYINKDSDVQRKVLKGLSLNLNYGEAIAIAGPSGSGKSTLLNIIGLLDLPNSGIVKFNGKETQHFSQNKLAEIRNKEIGFIFQSHHLLPQLNLLENVLLPSIPLQDKNQKKLAVERAKKLLEKVGLADKMQQYPGQLSGGECQRTAVVRALINEPKLILADEPTGSLDEISAEKIGELLSSIHQEQKVALIVVTHSAKLAQAIGSIYTLSNGKITQE